MHWSNEPPARVTRARGWAVVLCSLVVLGGCERLYMEPRIFSEQIATPTRSVDEEPGSAEPQSGVIVTPAPASSQAREEALRETIDVYAPGNERFVGRPRSVASQPSTQPGSGEITLNFENTNILEVVKVVLGDLLQQNYRVAPGVEGSVTLQTSRPIPKDALLPTLEMLLRANKAALVRHGGLFHVVEEENALRGFVSPQLGDTRAKLPKGFGVRIVPLAFIAAQEMHKMLEPFTGERNIVRVDTPRNLLVLAGSGPELQRLYETIEIFDVDWMAGMSVALFRPDFVDVKTLAAELREIFEDEGNAPLAGVVRFVELERLNGLLVITPRKVYLERVRRWIARLDKDPGGVGQRLYVYHVQNGRAVELAEVLSQVFEPERSEIEVPEAEVAPGLTPIGLAGRESAGGGEGTGNLGETPAPNPRAARAAAARRSTSAEEGLTLSNSATIRIIADEINNALLIKATAQEYKLVQAALEQLDIVPLQVLVEATIAEITLSDDLEFGLEWFFKNGLGERKTGNLVLDVGPAAGLAALAPGFSYAITDSAANVRAVLNALAGESRVNILSSPSLMVLNNQTATINVGDEVPVTTQQQQSTAGTSTIVNNIEFRDTGVLLTVTPRVNAGGLVTMEVEQEVSNVLDGTNNTLTPTIQQRKITSTVAVDSGDTVVLGGLIRENTTFTKGGIPVLHTLPVVGALFGNTRQVQLRTELVVLITPRVVQNRDTAQRITEEFRRKMQSLPPPAAPVPRAKTGG